MPSLPSSQASAMQRILLSWTFTPSTLSSHPLLLPLSASIPNPIICKLKTGPKFHRVSRKTPFFSIRNCSFIKAKRSSEIKKSRSNSKPDAKLSALPQLFSKPEVGIDAYIIPSQDALQSEFIAECYMRRACISGFTGSAGIAVVTKGKAALWTDGRYFSQAEKQLSSSWILMRAGNPGVPTTSEWLDDVLAPGGRVGIDPMLQKNLGRSSPRKTMSWFTYTI